VGAKLRKKSE